jgi:thiol-disulfide isomerase/thioredoxin
MIKRAAILLALLGALSGPTPAQSLRDLDGKARSIPELIAQPGTEAVVLVVWCSQCGSCRGGERDLAEYAKQGGDKIRVYAVDPHPTDTPEKIKRFLTGQGLKLNVLRDPNQSLVSGLKIDRTTTALVYDKAGKLRYIGPFQGDGQGYARDAVTQVLAGQEVSIKTRPLKGCPIPKP